MKPVKTTLALLAIASGLFAQSNPLTEAVRSRYQSIRQNLVETADVFPDDAYSYRLTPAQRNVAEWLAHTAMGNYAFCASIKGEKTPQAAQAAGKASAKPEVVKALRESFAYCDAALEGMTDEKALMPGGSGAKPVAPVQGMISLIASANEHYGNLVGYMRSKGIVPPSTARAQKKK
jgi:uncharacterized damage-inducible protein DinB